MKSPKDINKENNHHLTTYCQQIQPIVLLPTPTQFPNPQRNRSKSKGKNNFQRMISVYCTSGKTENISVPNIILCFSSSSSSLREGTRKTYVISQYFIVLLEAKPSSRLRSTLMVLLNKLLAYITPKSSSVGSLL